MSSAIYYGSWCIQNCNVPLWTCILYVSYVYYAYYYVYYMYYILCILLCIIYVLYEYYAYYYVYYITQCILCNYMYIMQSHYMTSILWWDTRYIMHWWCKIVDSHVSTNKIKRKVGNRGDFLLGFPLKVTIFDQLKNYLPLRPTCKDILLQTCHISVGVNINTFSLIV